MLESVIRTYYDRLLVAPIAKRLIGIVSPSQITLASGILGFLVFLVLLINLPILAVILLLLSGYCDTLDGAVARLSHQISNQGAVYDIVCDRFVEFFVILGLFSLDPNHRAWAAMFMLGSVLICITSFLVVGVFSQNTSEKSFHYSPGLMERPEAFIFFMVMMIWPHSFNWLAPVFSLLVILTAGLRVFEFSKTDVLPNRPLA
ncbi:MAG: CDP-alcohol phosphatidyltransferase family protein [Legionellales bacterium]|nr:CDP-alcohol phosphatidyltransferase family protein [Legionellales bacterium]